MSWAIEIILIILSCGAPPTPILHIPNRVWSTSKLGAPFDTHSRLHGQLSVACEPMTHGLLHIKYLEKKSLYVTELIHSIVSGTRAFSSTEYELSISMSIDMTEIRSSSFGLTWDHRDTYDIQQRKSRCLLAAAEKYYATHYNLLSFFLSYDASPASNWNESGLILNL